MRLSSTHCLLFLLLLELVEEESEKGSHTHTHNKRQQSNIHPLSTQTPQQGTHRHRHRHMQQIATMIICFSLTVRWVPLHTHSIQPIHSFSELKGKTVAPSAPKHGIVPTLGLATISFVQSRETLARITDG